MTRQLRVAVLSGLFLLSSLATVRSIKAQNAATVNAPPPQASVQSQRPDPAPERQADQMTNIPYYTLRDGLSSTLTLDNNAPTPTRVTITIFNAEGRAQTLDPMMLDPHSVKQIELRDVVLSELFDQGSLSVAYFGKEMDVTCQVSIYSLEKRVSFESREQGMMDFQTSNANGILWLPEKGAEGFLAITNISKNRVTVQVSVVTQTKEIELYSHETHVVKLSEEFGLNAPAAALVKLSQNGLPGDILTTGYVMDLKSGYSSAFTMFDPKNPRSSHLAGAHFRFGPPDPKEGFPPGTTFTSPLLLANVTEGPVKAHVSVDYTVPEKLEMTPLDSEKGDTEDKFNTIGVRDVTIAPGEVHRTELSDELANLGIPTPVTEAGVDVAYDAPPGALIAHLVSADQTGAYSFEVPMKDPAAWNAMLEGINPWTLEDGTRTVLHLKNTTNQAMDSWATLTFAGGSYNLPLLSFKPYQTIAIDIQALKDSKKPDARGIPFPSNATRGQAVWFPKTPYSLVGRAEQINLSEGIARSFSCMIQCCEYYSEQVCVSTAPCAPNWSVPGQHAAIPVSGLTGAVGGNGNLTGYDYGEDCNQNEFGPNTFSSPTWTAYNASVISINGSGNVSYVGAGSTSVGIKSAGLTYYDWGTGCTCHAYSYTQPAYTTVSNEQAPVNVGQVAVTGEDLENNYVNVTATGSGLSASLQATANGAGHSVTIFANSGNSVSAGQYSLTFNRTLMAVDKYTSVTGQWNIGSSPKPTQTVNLSRPWTVLGFYRHSQYNTPYESACTASTQTAWVFDSSCTFTQTTLKSDFVSQVGINGTGASLNYGVLKYSNGALCSGQYPPGANTSNSFLKVSSVTGSCNTTLAGGDAVAANPNPAVAGNTWVCGDNALLVTTSNTNQAIKHAQDYCPACNTGFNGTNGHIDDYSSSQSCSAHNVGDYGNFYTFDTH